MIVLSDDLLPVLSISFGAILSVLATASLLGHPSTHPAPGPAVEALPPGPSTMIHPMPNAVPPRASEDQPGVDAGEVSWGELAFAVIPDLSVERPDAVGVATESLYAIACPAPSRWLIPRESGWFDRARPKPQLWAFQQTGQQSDVTLPRR